MSEALNGGFSPHFNDMSSAFNIFEQFFGGRDPFADMDRTFKDVLKTP